MTETNISTTKLCTKCGETKSTDLFGRNKSRSDGLNHNCKVCSKAYMQRYYSENKSEMQKNNKANYQANKDAYKTRARKWEKENPERKRQLRADYRAGNKEKISFFPNEIGSGTAISARRARKHTARRTQNEAPST